MSELQLGLVALGVALVGGVLAYNKWQENQARRKAKDRFSSNHTDVLLDPGAAGNGATARRDAAPGVQPAPRIEPTLDEQEVAGRGEAETAGMDGDNAADGELARRDPVVPAGPVVEPPLTLLDGAIDCIVRFETAEALAAPLLWEAQQELLRRLTRNIIWLGLNARKGAWDALSRHSAGSYRVYTVGMQLADRRGAASAEDVALFLDGIRQLADRFLAVAELPEREGVGARASELDRFCAAVDVQIGVNLLSRDPAGFSGRALQEECDRLGMTLMGDGAFHLRDGDGRSIFSLSNLEPEMFSEEQLPMLTSRGVTFSLDVPCVADGNEAFGLMVTTARGLAQKLKGVVVDDNKAPLGDQSLDAIRAKITEFQAAMTVCGMTAGSPVARRLFS
ncbi:MAG: cell division protein ZipA C-terminal FtsZ-binding domain-containing protein [Betaproteobacteria bacterium]|nr:cell division protein ZipA C-terminal FtsZ-binding domain-containing protein [Betaproteobacteria bacterium]